MKIKSIYKQFYTKLIIATSFFLIILSFIFYEYAKSSFYSNIEKNLLKQAKHIEKSYISFDKFKNIFNETQKIELVFLENNQKDIKFIKFFQDDKTFAKLIFPMNDDAFYKSQKI